MPARKSVTVPHGGKNRSLAFGKNVSQFPVADSIAMHTDPCCDLLLSQPLTLAKGSKPIPQSFQDERNHSRLVVAPFRCGFLSHLHLHAQPSYASPIVYFIANRRSNPGDGLLHRTTNHGENCREQTRDLPPERFALLLQQWNVLDKEGEMSSISLFCIISFHPHLLTILLRLPTFF